MNRAGVGRIQFVPSTPHDARSGLLGWCSFTLADAVRIDGVTLRRTRAGRLTLSFPVRRDRAGVEHPIIRPIDDAARRQIEDVVLAALGFERSEAQP